MCIIIVKFDHTFDDRKSQIYNRKEKINKEEK